MKVKVGVIGATGYAGLELVRLLMGHSMAEICALSSVSYAGRPISQIYPALGGILDKKLVNDQDVLESCQVVFASLPHGLSMGYAQKCLEGGKLFIDLGADFRLEDKATYEKWYNAPYGDQGLHEKAVYGLCEVNRARIAEAKLIGNPGCYPTCAALGLYPALKAGLVEPEGIVIDAKSGATGAGRGLTQNTHFADCNEAFAPYGLEGHRHTPEIEQTLCAIAGQKLAVTFVPHLLPVNRGIVATMYTKLMPGADMEAVRAAYEGAYANEQFVRVRKAGEVASLKHVRCSNYCDISLHEDGHTGRLIVVCALDNMVKGAAGQAVQNMNIAMGLGENTGLELIPLSF